ncbi:MAG: RodZ domain-containing protein [Sinimarinibacterium sp.]|jgi:cytoskeleton protein RodZ
MTTDTPDPASTDESATNAAPVPEPRPGPGALIREARQRARLSLEDMAAHTKLARQTLDALERDDYKALLEPVYVRGYYRKCAKVLDMDEGALIAAYEARVAPRQPEAPSKLRLASGTELGSSSRLPVAMAVFAAVVAIVVCGFIWLARDGQDSYPVFRDAIVSETPMPTAPPVAPQPVAVDAAAPEAAAATPAADAAGPDATPGPGVASAATAVVRLRFRQTSWVRVDDAAGKVLINQTQAAGTEQTVNGVTPLNIYLGNAPGVEVEYDGKAVDIRSYVRDSNTARFSLPAP